MNELITAKANRLLEEDLQNWVCDSFWCPLFSEICHVDAINVANSSAKQSSRHKYVTEYFFVRSNKKLSDRLLMIIYTITQ